MQQESDAGIGAENSGHVILLDKTTTGDGIVAGLQVLAAMARNHMSLHDLCSGMILPPELATLGITELEYEFYRRLVEKQLLTYRLHGESWREKVIERPVVHKDYDEQPRGPFIV